MILSDNKVPAQVEENANHFRHVDKEMVAWYSDSFVKE